MDFARSGFQRNGSRIKSRRCAAQHGNRLPAQRLEIDPIRGVRVGGLRHVLRQNIRHIGAAAASKAARQDELPCGLNPGRPARLQMQPQMVARPLDANDLVP
jgi:hypothetical protein